MLIYFFSWQYLLATLPQSVFDPNLSHNLRLETIGVGASLWGLVSVDVELRLILPRLAHRGGHFFLILAEMCHVKNKIKAEA